MLDRFFICIKSVFALFIHMNTHTTTSSFMHTHSLNAAFK